MHRTRLLYRKTPSDENGRERARRGGRPSCYIRFSNALQLMETARYLCVEVDDSGGVGRTSVGMADECRRPPPTREVGKFGRFARAVRRITTSWTFASQANVTSSIEIKRHQIYLSSKRAGSHSAAAQNSNVLQWAASYLPPSDDRQPAVAVSRPSHAYVHGGLI